jgi:hypothetical protein
MMQNLESIHRQQSNSIENLSLPADFQSWPASQKQSFLWNERILRSQLDPYPPLQRIQVVGLFLTMLRSKMDRQSDEAPKHWKKAIHAHGSVAKIKFVPDLHTPFTGLFKRADWGLIRLSLTGDPSDRGFAPGLAIKFFVDGHHSENVSALVSLTGQGQDYNFFSHEFSNIVPVVRQIGPKLINLIFMRVSRHPTKLSLADIAKMTQSGEVEPQPCSPTQIFLVPNPALQFPSSPPHDFRADLATITPGTQLFSVYAVDPKVLGDEAIGTPQYRQSAECIGHLETTSEFVVSAYGDSQLFFRHQRFKNQ